MRLRKDGLVTIVQCKYWKSRTVGARPLRELFDLMTHERTNAAIFVTSGTYTLENLLKACRFNSLTDPVLSLS